MINTVFLVLHIIFVAIMIGLILLQKSEGGGLGMGGGNFMSARGTANLLTRSTAVMATLFFISTLALAISFKGSKSSTSILDTVAVETPKEKQAQTQTPMEAGGAPVVPTGDESKPSIPVAPQVIDKPMNANEATPLETPVAPAAK